MTTPTPLAELVAVAQAVTDALNQAPAGTFAFPFRAERVYYPIHAAEDLVSLEVTVVPRAWTPMAISRAQSNNEYVVDIGVQARLPEGLRTDLERNAAADPYLLLGQQILDYFYRVAVPGYQTAQCMQAAADPAYEPDHFKDFNVVTTVVRLTLRQVRALRR